MASADARLSSLVCQSDPIAVQEWAERDYGVADLFARTVAHPGIDTSRVVQQAMRWVLTEVVHGVIAEGLRAAVLRKIASTIDAAGGGFEEPSGLGQGTFLPQGDRWEGWWDEYPSAWPEGCSPARASVIKSLRRIPLDLRAVLLLRDVAGLSVDEVSDALGRSRDVLEGVLISAREAYLVAIDLEMRQ